MTAPKLPTERALARQFRELHRAFTNPISGGEFVCLTFEYDGSVTLRPPAEYVGTYTLQVGREYVPGDECPCAKTCPYCRGSGGGTGIFGAFDLRRMPGRLPTPALYLRRPGPRPALARGRA